LAIIFPAILKYMIQRVRKFMCRKGQIPNVNY